MQEQLYEAFERDFLDQVLPIMEEHLPRSWDSEPIYYYFDIVEIRKFRSGLPIHFARQEGLDSALAIGIGAAAELTFCAALLIDDIVDEDAMRSGQASAHERYGYPRAVATAGLALSVADEILSKAVARSALFAPAATKLRNIVADANKRMMRSFLVERRMRGVELDPESLLQLFRDKTSTGTASLAAVGCSHTGADDRLTSELAAFGEDLGIAGQIKNDVYDFTVLKSTREGASSDARNGYVTYPIKKLLACPACNRENILAMLALGDDASVAREISRFNVLDLCRGDVDIYVDRALQRIPSLSLREPTRSLLTLWANCNRLPNVHVGHTGAKMPDTWAPGRRGD
jgi:geranylgeranyl pyrophosphate synthase